MDPQEASRMCAAIADGLQHVHDQGILHRDLKPANVLFVPPSDDCPPMYRPRNPRASPLFQLFETHYETVKSVWEERFERQYGFWQGRWDRAVAAYLDCGLFESGFAVWWNPHIHAIVTRGVFLANGQWHPIPYVDTHKAELAFRHKLLRLLRDRDLISEERIDLLLSWRHSFQHSQSHDGLSQRHRRAPSTRLLFAPSASELVPPSLSFRIRPPHL